MNDISRFELVIDLPNRGLKDHAERLIGFEPRYARIARDLHMLLDPDAIRRWSKKKHGRELPICDILADRYPMVVFHGDVGTGKTATAEGVANQLALELQREATLLKLSTRVRGRGLHGEMSKLVGEAFDEVVKVAGKSRMAFLLIDEADALAASRDGAQLHQEERAGTNTLIQKIDDIRRLNGRVLVFLCTNRLHALDPAILRRAARLEKFARPSGEERREILMRDLEGVDLNDDEICQLVTITGPDTKTGRPGLTYSDIRTRFLAAAVGEAFPDGKLTFEILRRTAKATPPSPVIV